MALQGAGGEWVGRLFKPKGKEHDPEAPRLVVSMVGSGKVFWRDGRNKPGETPQDEFDREWVRVG